MQQTAPIIPYRTTNLNKTYHVLINSSSLSQQTSISYQAKIACVGWFDKEHYHFTLERDQLTINNEEPTEVLVYQLANECAQAIFPLHLKVHTSGKLKDISNYTEIIKRWQKISNYITSYYSGEAAENYIDLMNQTVHNEQLFRQYIQQDMLLNLYFCPISQLSIPQLSSQPITMSFPIVFGYEPVMFELMGSTAYNEEAITLNIEGVCNNALHILPLNVPVNTELKAITINSASITAAVDVDRSTYLIDQIKATFKWQINNESIPTILAYTIQTE